MLVKGDAFSQADSGVRFEWGAAGATHLAADAACLVVVDVLSFSAAVTVAVEKGTRVTPHPRPGDSAALFTEQKDARLAIERHEVTQETPWSLSPAALREAPPAPRLVLPSPGGSAIAAAAPLCRSSPGACATPPSSPTGSPAMATDPQSARSP
ncbi:MULTISPECIES: hypothetical protein [Streptomyces]|uniref:hypothetical protein n=1 Tax=Streptomyces TaxID=1883 RepID=UPI001F03ED54|nr:hypothetical protein [Streptomyces sp. SID7805]